ncbi:MAG: AAA family ATPase [Deltaproteobacteria bacterium]|jgi:chromosome partitioning protein|nr:AAA family ATPase [Deltaproteobacteria bacterium]
MIITCPRCKKQCNIDEKRIPANAKKARCKSCGNLFALNLPGKTDAAALSRETRIIGVALSKGGVGKTTTAVSLSAGLALAGHKVLLIDTDTQGQASYSLGVKPKAGLVEVVTEELKPEEAVCKVRERLYLLAGGKSLAGVKRLIDRKDFGGELTFRESLSIFEGEYDYIVVDTSPGWDALTVAVLFYVKEVLTPISLEVMALQGLMEFMKSLASIRKYRDELTLKYVVPTFLDGRVKQSQKMLEELGKLYSEQICPPIRYNVRISEAPAYGKSIYEYAPGSPGAHDYRELVRKVANNPKLFRQMDMI